MTQNRSVHIRNKYNCVIRNNKPITASSKALFSGNRCKHYSQNVGDNTKGPHVTRCIILLWTQHLRRWQTIAKTGITNSVMWNDSRAANSVSDKCLYVQKRPSSSTHFTDRISGVSYCNYLRLSVLPFVSNLAFYQLTSDLDFCTCNGHDLS